jgi:protocatechuate 3,4-dioxygenase beta subunit
MRVALLSMLIITAAAQGQTGRIEGVVLDAASRQPVKKAVVSITFMGTTRVQPQSEGPQSITTDLSGKFVFDSLATGQYQLTITHQDYPQAQMGGVRKAVQVSAGETTSSLTVELVPGATVSGHIVDEDGDPLNGCIVQIHPAKDFNQGVPMRRVPMTHEDGSYRLYGIPPGKYTITAQCSASVFQPRPLSEGPDPSPSSAYPIQFYSAASDLKSAEIVELLPGAEKSAVDFQIRPVPVTHIHGTLTAGSADWRGRNDLRIQLLPLDPHGPRSFGLSSGGQVDSKDGTFDLQQVFPGSYRLAVFSQDFSAGAFQTDTNNRVGAIARVDVADKPIELSLQLHSAMDISGTMEIESNNNSTKQPALGRMNLQLMSANQFGGPPPRTLVNEDGSFTFKSVLPGEWRIRLMAQSAFVKSVRLGSDDVTNRPLDLTSGSAAPLRIVVSTNTATIRGTAPAGQMVFSTRLDEDDSLQGWRIAPVDSNGQFTLQGLPPGKYRIGVRDSEGPPPDEGGHEVTVREGDTTMIDIKAETKP